MKKKAQCILLDTKTKGVLRQTTDGFGGQPILSLGRWGNEKHLYFVSDDKIDGPCWCINKNKDTLYYITDANLPSWFEINKDWNKVIATTNPELWVIKQSELITTTKGGIPKIGDDFISAYIKAYNEGSPITEVNLEYEDNGYEVDMEGVGGQDIGWMPKIELKLRSNGTVIISPIVEKMYTHTELSSISFNSFIVGIANPQLSATELVEFHKEWFDRNYPQ